MSRYASLLLLGSLLFFAGAPLHAAPADPVDTVHVDLQQVTDRFTIQPLFAGWRFKAGDDPSWADPATPDSAWREVNLGTMPWDIAWEGVGWFRLHAHVDSLAAARHNLALVYTMFGAIEVYLDGERIFQRGHIGDDGRLEEGLTDQVPVPVALPSDMEGNHLFAVRVHRSEQPQRMALWGFRSAAGFIFGIGPMDALSSEIVQYRQQQWIYVFTAGIQFAAGVFALLMWWRVRSMRLSLPFAGYAFSAALFIMVWLFIDSPRALHWVIPGSIAYELLIATVFYMGVLFLHEAFRLQNRMVRIILASVALVVLVVNFLFHPQFTDIDITFITYSLFGLEMIRSLYLAFKRRERGSRILLTGFALYLLGVGYEWLTYWDVLPSLIPFGPSMALAMLAPTVVMMIVYVRRFARVSSNLDRQLREVRRLSSESIANEHALRLKEKEAYELRNQMARERLETVQKLAVTLAHEFNNPLTTLQIVGDMLKREDIPEQQRCEQAGRIPGLVERMRELANRLRHIRSVEEVDYATGVKMLDLRMSSRRKDEDAEDEGKGGA